MHVPEEEELKEMCLALKYGEIVQE